MATDKFIDDTADEAIAGAADLLDQVMAGTPSSGDVAVVQAAATIAVARVLFDILKELRKKK